VSLQILFPGRSYIKIIGNEFNQNTPLKTQNGNFTRNRGQNEKKGVGLILGKTNNDIHDDDNDKRQI
jgi:hypothetical protein